MTPTTTPVPNAASAPATSSPAPLAVVTGGSRGIGAALCHELVARGFAVVFCYRTKDRRATAVVSSVRRSHPHPDIRAVRADITTTAGLDALSSAVEAHPGSLDVLVLNAAGGMEQDTPPNYATRINADAQGAVVDTLRRSLSPGARVVYLTSLQSHRFGSVPEFDCYRHIAESKHRGEQLLRAKFRDESCGGRLHIVVSDMVDGSPAALLMDLREPAAAAERRAEAARRGAPLPTVDDVARTVADLAECPPNERSSRTTRVHHVERITP